MYPRRPADRCRIFIFSKNVWNISTQEFTWEFIDVRRVAEFQTFLSVCRMCAPTRTFLPSGQAGNIQTHVFVSCLVSRGRYSLVCSSLFCLTSLDVLSHARQSGGGHWFSPFPVPAVLGGGWRVSALGEEVQTFRPDWQQALNNSLLLF